jgi:HlyD family secretion protein
LNAAAGDRVDNRALLATVASAMDLQVNANLAEAQAQRVGVGMTATIRVAGQAFAGSVAHVSPQTEVGADGAPVVPITLVFAEAPRGLRVGASASVEIEVGRVEEALYLPRGPYLTTGGERLAYVVEGETASRQTVVFGIIDGNRVEVRDGLSEGQRVIVSSYEAFRDRAQIRLAPEGEIR